MAYWLKLGYFTDSIDEGSKSYWMRRNWVSDGPGRAFSRWSDSYPIPEKGSKHPTWGPKFEKGDRLVIYMKDRGCPAIVEVVEDPYWNPDFVDQEVGQPEGDRWGVVTRVRGITSVELDVAPSLEAIGVEPRSVMRKGHIRLSDWQFKNAEAALGAPRKLPARETRTDEIASTDLVPVESQNVVGYETISETESKRAVRRESILVQDYVEYLEATGDRLSRIRARPKGDTGAIYSDVFNETRRQLIEAKAGTSRSEIRMAIGQLADYIRFVEGTVGRAVLLEARPAPDLLDLLACQMIGAIWRDGAGFDDSSDGEFT